MPFALWAAVIGLILGALAGAVGLSVVGGQLGSIAENQGVGVAGAFLGALVGLGLGFVLIYLYLVAHPLQLIGALISGAIISAIVFAVMVRSEPWLMELRGYRRPSRREHERLDPLLQEAGEKMGLSVVPALWVSDSLKPGAWAHMRAIVVTRGLLGDYDASERAPQADLDNMALAAILAHELRHWAAGDAVAAAMVTACFSPFVLIVNAVSWVQLRAEWAGIVLWAFFWPVWLASRFVIVPLMARGSRRAEYEADASAAGFGDEYRLGLRRALDELSAWERPRTGWEDVLSATHPPIELRLERLEAPAPAVPAGKPLHVALRLPDGQEGAALTDPAVLAAGQRLQEAEATGDEHEIDAASLEAERAVRERLIATRYALDRGEPGEIDIPSDEIDGWIARVEGRIQELEGRLQ